MATTGALGSLGSDLAFSVSFGIANELLDAAKEAHLSEDELIGIVLALSVILSAVPSTFIAMREEWRKYLAGSKPAQSSGTEASGGSSGNGSSAPKVLPHGMEKDGPVEDEERFADGGNRSPASSSGLLAFANLLLTMAQRISLSICVQLVASNVRSRQPLRSVRVVSLLAVAIFFLFLESTSSVGNGHE